MTTNKHKSDTIGDSIFDDPAALEKTPCQKRVNIPERRASCPGLPRGLGQVPATRAPPSAAPGNRAIKIAGGRAQIGALAALDANPCRRKSLEFRTSALSPGLPRGLGRVPGSRGRDSQRPLPRSVELCRRMLKNPKIQPPPVR